MGDVASVGVLNERADEAIETDRRVIADGHGRKGLMQIFVDGDQRSCWILEVGRDGRRDKVEHDAGEGEKRHRPEESIRDASAACNAGYAVRGRVQTEVAQNGSTTRGFWSRFETHRGTGKNRRDVSVDSRRHFEVDRISAFEERSIG